MTSSYVPEAEQSDSMYEVSTFPSEASEEIIDIQFSSCLNVELLLVPLEEPVSLVGTNQKDTLTGGDNNDTLIGRNGADQLNGNSSNDILRGGNGHDTLNGGDNNDTLIGRNGADQLNGNSGNDILRGGNGHDTLNGGDGHDTLRGGQSRDTLNGGDGNDILEGGQGRDVFILDSSRCSDTITDFSNSDVIGLADGLTFSDLSFSGSNILNSRNSVLATLTGVDTTTLTENDFVSV